MSEGITFGSWLKQRRNDMGITQDELAERLGFSPIMLWKIESGERRPSSQTAALLADYFHVPDDEREAFVIFARTGRAGAGSPDGGSVTAPWRAATAHHTNLPQALTPLIGRKEDERAILDLFLQLRSKVRLLTLTGAPGIGKTRLALQVASRLVEHFDDGVFMVELAPVSDPELVISTMAQTLGVREIGGQALEESLRQHLQGRRMLLVLDNFEQVLDAAPALTRLMEASPWLKVLATSREALHVRGERRFPVPPLAVPELAQIEDVQALGANPSVELFVERAQSVQPGFTLTQENARDVASICARLEGLPLAIELAAARARLLTPGAMLARLEHRLSVLAGGARDLPERQRTLRSTIEWSYNLLSDNEQKLFRGLSVFVGGCTLEAVEALFSPDAELKIDVSDGLGSLIDKSLVSIREGVGREPRFTMLEMIGEYAFERLKESTETQVVQERHARYFLRLAEEAEPELRGPQQMAWLDRLEMEHDNMRAALRWALENKAGEIGLCLVGALRWFWTLRSHHTESLRWGKAVLAMPAAQGRSATRAKALWSSGGHAWMLGDPEARPILEESVSIWREIGDKCGLGNSLFMLGMTMLQQGQPEVALSLELESIDLLRAAGDKSGLTLVLGAVVHTMMTLDPSEVHGFRGDYKEFRALLEESTRLSRELEDKWSLALNLRNLGWLAMREGDYEEARPLMEESLALQWEMGSKHEAAATLSDLGQLAQLDGDLEKALELYERSLDVFRECAAPYDMVMSMVSIGSVALLMGNIRSSAEVLIKALTTVKELGGSARYALMTLEAVGWLMVEIGQPARAAVLMSAVQALYKANPFPRRGLVPRRTLALIEQKRYLEIARAQVDEATWEEMWAKGETMTIEEALQFASESLEASIQTPGEE